MFEYSNNLKPIKDKQVMIDQSPISETKEIGKTFINSAIQKEREEKKTLSSIAFSTFPENDFGCFNDQQVKEMSQMAINVLAEKHLKKEEVDGPQKANAGDIEEREEKKTLSSARFSTTHEPGFEVFNDDQINTMIQSAFHALIAKNLEEEDLDRLGHVFTKRGPKCKNFFSLLGEEKYKKDKDGYEKFNARFEEICKNPNPDISLHSVFKIAAKYGWKLPAQLRKSKKYALQCTIEYLEYNYDFRYNVITHKLLWKLKIESSYSELTDRDFNTIFHKISRHEEIEINDSDFGKLLESEFVPAFDPLTSYLDNLPEWDGIDYISNLAETISCEPSHSPYWSTSLRKWFVGLVAGVYSPDEFNSTAIILQGKQNLGKSRWIRKLVPLELREYLYTGTIDPRDKDFKIAIFTNLLVDLDELDALTRYDVSTIKSMMTLKYIKIRAPYGRFQELYMRRSSFIGSVNKAEFLNDPTGTRRFLCFPVFEINPDHDVNIDMVYSQAKYLYKSGERYWFDFAESEEVTKLNQEFSVSTLEEDLINQKYVPCDVSDLSAIFFSTTELTQLLFPDHIDNAARLRVGHALTKLGYMKLNKKRNGSSVKLWAGKLADTLPTDAIYY
jgi:hypothetical protein